MPNIARRARHRSPWLTGGLAVLVLASLAVFALTAAAATPATVTPSGTVSLVWEPGDLAGIQLAHKVMVLPIAATTLTPVPSSVELTSPISGGSIQTSSPYWGPVHLAGGIRFLKLTPAKHWKQVTITDLTVNIKTQGMTGSIDGARPVRVAGLNEMGLSASRISRDDHTYVELRGGLLSYAPRTAAALKAAFGYSTPAAPSPFATLNAVVRLG